MTRAIVSLVCIIAAARAQAQLEFRHVQAAYGPVGPERKSLVYYPGDDIIFRYLLAGVTTDAQGQLDTDISMQVADGDGKILVNKKLPTKAVAALGGGCLPGYVRTTLGQKLAPGKYQIRVKASDNVGGHTASFERDVTLKEVTFTPISQRFFLDADGKVASTSGGVIGQSLYYRMGLIGFDRSGGRVETHMDLQILDDHGKETLSKPIRATYMNENVEAAKKVSVVNLNGFFALNRAGEFTLRFSFIDTVGNQKAQFEVPLRVREP
jgi:hypothetical protein